MQQDILDGPALNAWRKSHGLYVHELADLFGYPLSKMKDRLYGRIRPKMTAVRMTRNCDYLLALGCPPDGWPERLMHAVKRNRIAPIDGDHEKAAIAN